MRSGLRPETKQVAPIFVSAANEAPRLGWQRSLRSALSRAGYRIADSREQSALALDVSWGGDQRQTLAVGSSTVQTAIVSLSLVAGWTYRDEPFLRSTVQGEGRSFSGDNVIEKGISAAVEKLVEAMNSAISE